MRIEHATFLLLLFAMPWDTAQYARIDLGFYRLAVLDLLLLVNLAIDFVHSAVTSVEVLPFVRRTLWLCLIIALLSTISLLYITENRWGTDIRMTLNLVQLCALVYLTGRRVRDMPSARAAMTALVLGCLVVAVATALKSFGLPVPGGVRVHSLRHLGPVQIGVVGLIDINGPLPQLLLTTIPLMAAPAVIRSPAVRVAALSVAYLAALVHFTRALWLALLVQTAVMLIFLVRRARHRALATLIASITLGAGLATAPWLLTRMIELRPSTVTGRLEVFRTVVDLATASPRAFLFGAGKGFQLSSTRVMVAHNVFLDFLVSKGIVTVLALLLLLAMIVRALLRIVFKGDHEPDTKRFAEALLAALCGVITLGLAHPISTSGVFWVALALAAAFIAVAEVDGWRRRAATGR